MCRRIYTILLFTILCISSFEGFATHIIGGEIGYKNMGSLAYEITLTLYGDCAGSSFPSLPSAIPRIRVYKDNVPFSFIDLALDGPGVEVTPVCPAEIGNTTCVSTTGTIPGIMRFIYKGNITLDGTSANWAFLFNSSLGSTAWAGRTNAITNIYAPSQMALEATLNNVGGPNNSSIFTTIPTPFFCINLAQEYNQGAVDQDGDQLSFALVPGLDADNTGTVTGNVNYVSPYTYLNPLGTVPGSFGFNTNNGQMSFTPNMIQTSLVVNKVTEKRGGVIVGTAMREMNLVVLNNCANQSPTASIPTSNVGAFDTLTRTLTICNSSPTLQFVINASDPDNQNVNITVTGLPSGASANITGNGSLYPIITINWNLPLPIMPGSYTFYVNCEDDGCPLKSKQTIAYSVIIIQPIVFTATSVKESCVPGNDGMISINAGMLSSLLYSIDGGINFLSTSVFNGLNAGTYTVVVKDSLGCSASSVMMIESSPKPIITNSVSPESCIPGNDGSIVSSATSVNGMVTGYSINGSTFQLDSIFLNLQAGIYLIVAQDIAGCTSSTQVIVPSATIPQIASSQTKNITCFGNKDGSIQVMVNPVGIVNSYTLLPLGLQNTSGQFTNLAPGNYTLIAGTAQGCADTITILLSEPPQFFIIDIDIINATCDKDNASIKVQTNYPSPLIYTLRPATLINTIGFFSNVAPGVYTVSVRDSNFCEVDSVIQVDAEPNLFTTTMYHEDLQCHGFGSEGMAVVTASGGVWPYTYLWTGSSTSNQARIENLFYGWYFVTVTDITGCETHDTVYIKPGSCCEEVYLPNAFSPNNDGQNDTWRIVSSTGMLIDKFAVYDRWGNVVWYTKNPRDVWDGTYNGKEATIGTYFYILQYECLSDGKNYLRKGDVTVLR
ncbi:MAG: gliding motility-associated C-terminal domain-containing protein [Bacteroidetes bacterium]|nr:gliding motility-associated C-terminal domain-containing protein [Bacteroidota bacterium]